MLERVVWYFVCMKCLEWLQSDLKMYETLNDWSVIVGQPVLTTVIFTVESLHMHEWQFSTW